MFTHIKVRCDPTVKNAKTKRRQNTICDALPSESDTGNPEGDQEPVWAATPSPPWGRVGQIGGFKERRRGEDCSDETKGPRAFRRDAFCYRDHLCHPGTADGGQHRLIEGLSFSRVQVFFYFFKLGLTLINYYYFSSFRTLKTLRTGMLSVFKVLWCIRGINSQTCQRYRSKDVMPALNNMSGLLIDVAKHLSNLKYRVWEKLLDQVDYSEYTHGGFTQPARWYVLVTHWPTSCPLAPVTLDPNTAHPCLVLSEDLTSLHYSKRPSCCPDNPERFHISAEVVGMTALDAGSHHWVVATGSNSDWFLGVASSSILRNVEISARPENGFWTLCFRDGEFRAMTSPPTPLTVSNMPKQVKVQLDYNNGLVSFLDPADNSLIYEFTQTFTEPLFPYFYTQSSHPLRIMPEKVLIAVAEWLRFIFFYYFVHFIKHKYSTQRAYLVPTLFHSY